MTSSSSEAGQVGSRTSTMFNKTCDRLREYLKENGSLGITLPSSSSSRTLNLFPTERMIQNRSALSPVSNINNSSGAPTNCGDINNAVEEDDPHHVPKQMTIFYNGQVIVVENVSRDKASEIVRVATNLSLSSAPPPASRPATNTCDLSQLPQAIVRDLSQTRSRSLTRFFEKRKDRINTRAPYTLRGKSWLGLSAAPEK